MDVLCLGSLFLLSPEFTLAKSQVKVSTTYDICLQVCNRNLGSVDSPRNPTLLESIMCVQSWVIKMMWPGSGADEHRKGEIKQCQGEIKQCQGLRQGNGAWQQSWTCLFTGSDLLAIVPGSDEQKFLLVQHFQDGD